MPEMLPLKDRIPRGVNRASLAVGSPDWCWLTVDLARRRYQRYDTILDEWDEVLGELKSCIGVIPEGQPYRDLDQLLKREVGVTVKESRREIGARPGPEPGSRTKAKQNAPNDSIGINKCRGGNNEPYLSARLARDFPEIKAQLDAGQFPSVRAAARAAGLVRPTAMIYTDSATDAARALLRHFQGDRLAELIRYLKEVSQ